MCKLCPHHEDNGLRLRNCRQNPIKRLCFSRLAWVVMSLHSSWTLTQAIDYMILIYADLEIDTEWWYGSRLGKEGSINGVQMFGHRLLNVTAVVTLLYSCQTCGVCGINTRPQGKWHTLVIIITLIHPSPVTGVPLSRMMQTDVKPYEERGCMGKCSWLFSCPRQLLWKISLIIKSRVRCCVHVCLLPPSLSCWVGTHSTQGSF